jgi:ATP-binding cassette subfamily B protein
LPPKAKELKRQSQRLQREFTMVDQIIHKGYVILTTWQELMIQSCVFAILVLTLVATLRGNISLGHFVTTLTVSSMAYSELEPISNLAEMFARRYACHAAVPRVYGRAPGYRCREPCG